MSERVTAKAALAAILLLALAFRLVDVGFGLPSLYDPDEPIFMVHALKLLTDRTLNPGWFGHPGTTTIYLVALIDLAVVGGGLALGRFASLGQFAAAAYADPALLFIPSRLAMVALGVACVALTYCAGRRLYGRPAGLVAAALLAVNPLHIAWSQVVRTDIQATVFMLGALLFALRYAETGRPREILAAGLFVGFAMATKWPSAPTAVAIAGACWRTLSLADGRRQFLLLCLAGAMVLAGLFIASPYIFLDWRTVVANVGGEVKAGHLGHNSGGLAANFDYYVIGQIGGSIGLTGLLLAAGGIVLTVARHRVAAWTLLPLTLAFLALICSQHIIWSRWVLPLLPMTCLFAGLAVVTIAGQFARALPLRGAAVATGLALALAVFPSAAASWAGLEERRNDTRDQAAAWARANIPTGRSLILEHLALDLRGEPWRIRFPVGEAGCLDAKELLRSGVRYERVEKLRNKSQIVDLGNVGRIETCRADFAILTYYDLYRAEAPLYPRELANYAAILRGGHTVALFRPRFGVASGPVVRIVAMGPQMG